MSKLAIAAEFWEFLKVRKKWWLAPIVVFLGLLGALIVFTEGSAVAPFIYTLFQAEQLESCSATFDFLIPSDS